jgi:hypothetical protein
MFAESSLSSSSYGYFGIGDIILSKEDYNDLIASNFINQYQCSPSFEQIPERERKITKVVEEKDNQYTVSLIFCRILMKAGCFESIFLVDQGGTIERRETEEFIKCDMSLMF